MKKLLAMLLMLLVVSAASGALSETWDAGTYPDHTVILETEGSGLTAREITLFDMRAQGALTVGKEKVFELYTEGGTAPYSYVVQAYWQSFADTTLQYSTISGTSAIVKGDRVTVTVPTKGRYLFVVGVQDADGTKLTAQTRAFDCYEEKDADDPTTVPGRVAQIVGECVKDGMTDWEKALALHDWLTDNANYDNGVFGVRANDNGLHDPQGVLLNGTGVCDSYAKAYDLLLEAAGLTSMVVTGYTDGKPENRHAWNVIRIGDEWTNVDVTWDDPVDTNDDIVTNGGGEDHSWFCLDSEAFDESHTATLAGVPKGTSTSLSYAAMTRKEGDLSLACAYAWYRGDKLYVRVEAEGGDASSTSIHLGIGANEYWLETAIGTFGLEVSCDGEVTAWAEDDNGSTDAAEVGTLVYIGGERYKLTDNGEWYTEDGTALAYLSSEAEAAVPTGITTIGSYALQGDARITSVTMPASVRAIGGGAFMQCTSLKSVALSEGLQSIGGYAFAYCGSLSELELPYGMRRIEGFAFRNCSSLKRIKIPATVTFISPTAFSDCSKTLTIEGEEGSAAEAYAERYGMSFTKVLPVVMKQTVLPTDTQRVGSEAFRGTSVECVIVPDGCTEIGAAAFADCAGLLRVDLPASVTSIADDAFSGSTRVTLTVTAGSYAARYATAKGITVQVK